MGATGRLAGSGVSSDWSGDERVPDDVLLARVALVFQTGDKSNKKNYRPISSLSTMNKLFAAVLK
eukprot:15303146-Alexandrium_andersonii.AAC.1